MAGRSPSLAAVTSIQGQGAARTHGYKSTALKHTSPGGYLLIAAELRFIGQMEVEAVVMPVRCSVPGCCKRTELMSTDDLVNYGYVRIGTGLSFCAACAQRTGFVEERRQDTVKSTKPE